MSSPKKLEVGLDEMGDYHMRADGVPAAINSTCTVFAESEIISLLARGERVEGIVAGIHHSIARRVACLVKRTGMEDRVLFDGGPALNKGLVDALEKELGRKIAVFDNPQITTALGAARIARRRCRALL